MARVTRRVALAALLVSPLAAAETGSDAPSSVPDEHQVANSYCVWPAVGGAFVGLAAGWYGYVGVSAAQGRSAFDLPSTPASIALTVGLEWIGLSAGATAGCALWGNEGRWLPTAVPVITGSMLGGAAMAGIAWGIVGASRLDANTDNPVGASLLILGLTTGGLVAGGFGGFALDRALRGAPSQPSVAVGPMVGNGRSGLLIAGTW